MNTLRGYLRSRLLLLGFCIITPLIYLVFMLYQFGLDDATELYLQQDMDWAISSLEQSETLPESTVNRYFFLDKYSLPIIYKYTALDLPDAPYLYINERGFIHYGLHRVWRNRDVYVFHVFPEQENVEGLQLESIVLMLIGMILAMMVLGGWFIYHRISSSMKALQAAVDRKAVSNQSDAEGSLAKLEFKEVNDVAMALKLSIKNLALKTEQEKQFIQSLSHELRTPMAIIQVAIEVLKKQPLDLAIESKLSSISNANQKMQSLADQLLGLWGHESGALVGRLEFKQILLDSMNTLDEQYQCIDRFEFKCESNDVWISGPAFAVQLVVMNILKNAVIHGAGVIQIQLTQTCFQVVNTINDKTSCSPNESVGMGLFIVNRAINALGWTINHPSSPNTTKNYHVVTHF